MRTPEEVAMEVCTDDLWYDSRDAPILAKAIAADRREVQLTLLDEIRDRAAHDPLFATLPITEDIRAELQQDDGKRPLEAR